MTVGDIGIIATMVSVIMAIFTGIIWKMVDKVDGHMISISKRSDDITKRLDDHISAINARTDSLQKAMMEMMRHIHCNHEVEEK